MLKLRLLPVRVSMRTRAIALALWYGLLPWWLYERRCHYAGMGYFAHLRLNLSYAWKWATNSQNAGDIRFEVETNNSHA